jgi:hypothetical protein
LSVCYLKPLFRTTLFIVGIILGSPEFATFGNKICLSFSQDHFLPHFIIACLISGWNCSYSEKYLLDVSEKLA